MKKKRGIFVLRNSAPGIGKRCDKAKATLGMRIEPLSGILDSLIRRNSRFRSGKIERNIHQVVRRMTLLLNECGLSRSNPENVRKESGPESRKRERNERPCRAHGSTMGCGSQDSLWVSTAIDLVGESRIRKNKGEGKRKGERDGPSLPGSGKESRESRDAHRASVDSIASIWGTRPPIEIKKGNPKTDIFGVGSAKTLLTHSYRECRDATYSPEATLFESLVKRFLKHGRWVELLYRIASDTKELDRQKCAQALAQMKQRKAEREIIKDQLFSLFAESIGVSVSPGLKFKKSVFDVSMEECFGTLNQQGSEIFCYPGLEPLPLADDLNAQRVFSLYLGRKVFVNSDPQDLAVAESSFYQRVQNVAPVRLPNLRDRALLIMKALSVALFVKTDKIPHPYNSGKSCVEASRHDGGKRVAEYVMRVDTDSTREVVVPLAIFTGGKVRVITKDSVFNARFAHFNKWMGDEVRRCSWSIFGRSVSSWLEKGGEKGLLEYEQFASGDLECATDYFLPEVADVAIDVVATMYGDSVDGMSVEEIACQIKAFTTHAEFFDYDPDRIPTLVSNGTQKRGQLMGSILSFPILCLASLTAYLVEDSQGEELLVRYSDWLNKLDLHGSEDRRTRRAFRKLRRFVQKGIKGVGVNGDDIVFGTDDGGSSWERGVEAIGGVVSKGKTLLSPTYLTVNSEMWMREGEAIVQVEVVRPSLIVSLNNGIYKVPQEQWKEYLNSPLRCDRTDEIFQLARSLFPNMPRTWGGLGVDRIGRSVDMDWFQFFVLRASRSRTSYDRSPVDSNLLPDLVEATASSYTVLRQEVIDQGFAILRSRDICDKPGWYPRAFAEERSKRLFQSAGTVSWSCPDHYVPEMEVVFEAASESFRNMTDKEREGLWGVYCETFDREEEGLVYCAPREAKVGIHANSYSIDEYRYFQKKRTFT